MKIIWPYIDDIQKQSPGGALSKKFLEISQNSQENTCTSVSFLITLQLHSTQDSSTGVFLWIFAKFLRTHFLTEYLRRILHGIISSLRIILKLCFPDHFLQIWWP